MMTTTHAAVGLTLVAPLVWAMPDLAAAMTVGTLVGGVFPDVDLFIGVYRKTLHFPVYYSVAAAVFGGVAAVSSPTLTVGAAFLCLSAGLHSTSDWLGAGGELRPWDRTFGRAVYTHPAKRRFRPHCLVRYDSAPEDLVLTLLFSVPGFLTFSGGVRVAIAAGVAVALFYAGFRKRTSGWFDI